MSQGYSGDPNNPYNQAGNANIPNPYGMTGPPNPNAAPPNSNSPYGPNPYGSNSGNMYPPPPPNSGSKTLLFVLGGIGALLMLGCCGMCGSLYLAEVGFKEKSKQLQQDFANHPIVQEELGGINEVQHSWSGTINEDGEDDLVFEAKGPKGKGQLIVTEEGFGDEQTSVRLRTSKGEWELLEEKKLEEKE